MGPAFPSGMTVTLSEPSPVSGAVTLTATVANTTGLVGVQFKLDGYVLEARDTTAPYSITWSTPMTGNGGHTLTAEAQYSDGTVLVSPPLVLTVSNPTTFNRLLYVDAAAGSDANTGSSASSPWRTLDQANAEVRPGDTVYLKGSVTGQYIRPAIDGTAARPITYKNWPGFQASLGDAPSTGNNVWLSGMSFIIVEGLTLRDSSDEGVQLRDGAHHITLRNNTIERQKTVLVQSSDNVIEGNTIRDVGSEADNTGEGIWMSNGSSRNKILWNTLTNAGHGCVTIGGDGEGDAEVGDNVVAHNTISNRWAMPLSLNWMARRTLVEYNRIADATQNGVNYPRYGITLQASQNIIRYNEIVNNTGGGFQILAYTWASVVTQDSIGNQIYHNVIYGNGGPGVWMQEKHSRQIKDNLIANNLFFRNAAFEFNGDYYTLVIEHYHNPTAWPAGSLNGNKFLNNVFLRQPGAAGEVSIMRIRNASQGDNLYYTVAGFQAAHADAKNNLEADPRFVNEAARDFHLQLGSPAIDRGVILPGRPYVGAAPDIGRYEFGAPP